MIATGVGSQHISSPSPRSPGLSADLAELAQIAAERRRLEYRESVLLAGVNDSAATLAALSERLVELGVTPYYLHLLDRVAGAAHFDVPAERSEALHRQLRDTLPGYAVPRLVREVPGEPAKVWIA